MWPARCAVSVMPGGAIIFPVNSSTDRTSTRWAGDLFSTTAEISSHLARIALFGDFNLYVVVATAGFSVVAGRVSFSHFVRPPVMLRTFSSPSYVGRQT